MSVMVMDMDWMIILKTYTNLVDKKWTVSRFKGRK